MLDNGMLPCRTTYTAMLLFTRKLRSELRHAYSEKAFSLRPFLPEGYGGLTLSVSALLLSASTALCAYLQVEF